MAATDSLLCGLTALSRPIGLVPPSVDGEDPAASATALSRRVASRLRAHGLVGLSSFFADPGTLSRALEEAARVLDVVRLGGAPAAGDVGDGTYRLLFRVLASHPEEVRSFYEDTIAPLSRYDLESKTPAAKAIPVRIEA